MVMEIKNKLEICGLLSVTWSLPDNMMHYPHIVQVHPSANCQSKSSHTQARSYRLSNWNPVDNFLCITNFSSLAIVFLSTNC